MTIDKPIKLALISSLITASTILAISFLIEPNQINRDLFWYRVMWTEVLNIIFWYGALGWFSIGKSTNFSLSPSISLLTTSLCISSFSIMLLEYHFKDIELLRNYNLTIQLLLLSTFLLIYIAINLSSYYANRDLDIPDHSGKSPNEISDFLYTLEKSLTNNPSYENYSDLINKIKILREKLKYSFQDNAKTRSNSEYIEFSSSIFSFCKSLDDSLIYNEELNKKNNHLEKQLAQFINNIERIASSIRRS